jgi:hypothetical protein
MIYRGPDFLAVVWFGSSPTPSPSPALPAAHRKTEKKIHLADWRVGAGVKSYDTSEKAWSSINHSIFSSWERGGRRKRNSGTLRASKKGHEEEGEKENEARIRGGGVARLQFDCRYIICLDQTTRTVQYITAHECDG